MTARHHLPAVCPTCLEPWRTGLTWTFDPDPIWAHAVTRPAPWCRQCNRPWLRWCTWHPEWRGGPGPVTRHELEAA